MDNFDKYHKMREDGHTYQEIYLSARGDNLNSIECVRMLMVTFQLSVREAQEVMITANGFTIDEYALKMALGLKKAADIADEDIEL